MDHTLVLMRHAKSDYPSGVSDHERPLARRGLREAALAGTWLSAHQPAVGEVLSSSATRARQTAEASGIEAPIRVAAEVYDASPDEILSQIVVTAENVETLLVVGHAPGIPALAIELAAPDSDLDAVAKIRLGFPTCALAVLSFSGSWSDLDFGAALLKSVHSTRD